jgi:DUF4097 and DUF4098 domain-containing protein YvlB
MFVLAAALSLGGLCACNLDISTKAEARDTWERHYTLSQRGTLEISNTNGVIRVEPGEGDKIDVTADRIVRAPTDQAAKEALAAFEIHESIAPDHVALDSSNQPGLNLTINTNRRVDYRVRVPRSANLRLQTTNGNIEVTGPLGGAFRAESTNGNIQAAGLENGGRGSTTNGSVSLALAGIGEDGVSCETTNGRIDVTLPTGLNARISARVTNGAIRATGLTMAVSEQSRRRLEATLGAGGPAINLETTNGAIELHAAK